MNLPKTSVRKSLLRGSYQAFLLAVPVFLVLIWAPDAQASFWGFLEEAKGKLTHLSPKEIAFIAALPFVLGVLITIFVLLLLRGDSKSSRTKTKDPDIPTSRERGSGVPEGATPDLPAAMFPGEWKERSDKERLALFVKNTKAEAYTSYKEAFFETLGKKSPSKLKDPALLNVSDRIENVLSLALGGDELLIAMGAGDLDDEDRAVFRSHLRELLAPFTLPPLPAPIVEVRLFTVALLAALGAFFGNLGGSALSGFLGYPQAVGALLGCVLGAFIPVASSVYLAQHRRVRLALMALVGTMAVVDTAAGIIRLGTLSLFLGGGESSRVKRLLMYLVAFLILLLVKGSERFDAGSYDASVSYAIESYLEDALPLVNVLIFRVKSGRGEREDPSTKVTNDLVLIIKKLLNTPGSEDNLPLQDLKRRLSLAGYEMEAAPYTDTFLEWSDSLKSRYETFGYVKTGQMVTVEEEPVVKNGEVLRKGQVVPR
ncbi:MAG: hypothetical protein LBE27_07615 [Deltaproteobacteria bacterium]|jgi:hypothetical protein|nr:hypothetical protein [Deltaproteobacteria bacterium]